MNRKIINSNGYTVGSYSKWHKFMDSIANGAVLMMVIALLVVIVLTATVLIWA